MGRDQPETVQVRDVGSSEPRQPRRWAIIPAELPEPLRQAIADARMDPENNGLNALLENEQAAMAALIAKST